MLCLNRKAGEKIILDVGGELIEVLVVHLHSKIVRLGFKASNHVKIDREEVFEAKQANWKPDAGRDSHPRDGVKE